MLASAATVRAELSPPVEPGRTRLHAVDDIPYPDVRDIAQDGHGFIWFGVNHQSQGGLLRYDGLETIRYSHDPADQTSLSHNQVYLTYLDRGGVLWVGTIRGGLNRYNAVSDDFTRFLHDPTDETSLPSDDIKAILQASDGTLWIGTETGLARFDPTTETFESFYHDPDDPNSLPSSAVHAIVEDPDSGDLWLGTTGGMAIFNPTDGTTRTYTSSGAPQQPQRRRGRDDLA